MNAADVWKKIPKAAEMCNTIKSKTVEGFSRFVVDIGC
jgi:hypothetical protein